MTEHSATPLLLIEEWEDEDTNGGEWPYPTRYMRSIAQGELAERIRRALGVTGDASVYVVERVESGGYSEYTQEDDYYLTITVGSATRELDGGWGGGFTELIRWLDQEAPVPGNASGQGADSTR